MRKLSVLRYLSAARDSLRAWVSLIRPKTMPVIFAPVLVGSALARFETGRFSWLIFALALAASACLKAVSDIVNDLVDLKRQTDTAERIGPKRALHTGEVSLVAARRAAAGSAIAALVLGIPLVFIGGLPIAGAGLASLAAAYAYTGGPFPLAYLGLGDIFVVLFYGFVATLGIYYLHTGQLGGAAVVVSLQIGLLATVLIAINNIRDLFTDVVAGKKTLVVRFGLGFGRGEVTLLLATPFLLQLYWWQRGLMWAAFLPCLAAPLAARLGRTLWREPPGPGHNRLLADGGKLQFIFSLLLTLGLLFA